MRTTIGRRHVRLNHHVRVIKLNQWQAPLAPLIVHLGNREGFRPVLIDDRGRAFGNLGQRLFPLFPRRVILTDTDLAQLGLIVLVISVAASLLGIWRALRVSPNEALA